MQFQDPELKTKSPTLRCDDQEKTDPDQSAASAEQAPARADLQVQSKDQIDGYQLAEIISQGASGQVWQATDRHGAPVAVKLFKKELASNPDAMKRFALEVKNLKRISHPNVVTVLDSGETKEGLPYIAMEFVKGQTVKSLLDSEGVFEPKAAAQIAGEVCRALTAAHAQTIIHRDIKPSNIIVTDNNSAKLIDFGVAKASGYSGETITQLGEIVGTPEYMSPEQCLGGLVDERSDIYSLGCTLFEMLTGFKAFAAANTVESIAKQINDDRQEIHARLKTTGLPEKLQNIMIKCLEREPSNRFQNAGELEHDLNAFLLGVPLRFTGRTKAAHHKLPRSRYLAPAVLAVVGVLISLFFSLTSLQDHNQIPPPHVAPPLHTQLAANALPSAPLPVFKQWLDAQLAEHSRQPDGANSNDPVRVKMEKSLTKALSQSQYRLQPDAEGVIYFRLDTDGKIRYMRPVGWRNARGVVSDYGGNIALMESTLASAALPSPSAPRELVLLYNASGFVIKDLADVPSEMKLPTNSK